MIIKDCVGVIPPTPPHDITTWASNLLQRASSALKEGNRLAVFEVQDMEIQPGSFDQVCSKPFPDIDAMLFDPEFLQSL